MSRDKQIEEITQYYVLRNKYTGMYFRGKGINRWGKYINQATIYRVKGTAVREVSWHGEKVEIVPIQIFENDAGYRKSTDLAEEIFELIDCAFSPVLVYNGNTVKEYLAELKKKYTEER